MHTCVAFHVYGNEYVQLTPTEKTLIKKNSDEKQIDGTIANIQLKSKESIVQV